MNEFLNFIEKFPVRKNITPKRKLELLKKALTLMESMKELDVNNKGYWEKRADKIWGHMKDAEGEIIRLELEGKEILKEVL